MIWVVLPGLALAPEDYVPLARAIDPDGDVRVLDAWRTPVTDPAGSLRSALDVDGSDDVALVGHSAGGLAALEWALLHPDEVRRLVLLDPSSPFERHRPALHPGTRASRAGRAAVGAVADVLAPTGPALRRAAVRAVAHRPDDLARDVAAARYGDRAGWLDVADQWTASWEQAPRVRRLLDDGRAVPSSAHPLLITGTRASARFLREQRELAERLDLPRVGVAEEGHLFPLTRADAVGRLVRDG
ncbi:alpha/beta hydrolase [Cellulosimicrobium sp. PMB13]|uniref:alpha/beta fold hydrolase n=1 Tax=Cellulosimicrobium sp. PMB13 TaxID=3120158 RepID=UPI003F4BF754